jgi:hypothetical protein
MVERNVLALFAILASFGLSGCFAGGGAYTQAGVQPSQEILDGTLRNPEDWQDAPRRTARRSAKVTIGAVNAGETTTAPAVYTDEWWAKEKLNNERLSRQLTICRAC